MIYTIAAILAALGSLAAWIYNLLHQNESLKYQVEQQKANAEIREWQDKIDKQKTKISEDMRNYEEAKRSLNDPPSGAV